MTLENARKLAQADANKYDTTIVILDDPIGTEDEDGPYGYCAPEQVKLLYRWGKVVETIKPLKQ